MEWTRWVVNSVQSAVLILMLVGVRQSATVRYILFAAACAVGCFYLVMAWRSACAKDRRGMAINVVVAVIDAIVATAMIMDVR